MDELAERIILELNQIDEQCTDMDREGLFKRIHNLIALA